MEKKYHTIVTLLKYTQKIVGTEAKFIHLTHLYHDCSLPWIGKVTLIEIGVENIVLGPKITPLNEIMRSSKFFLRE
jgi:hypothetical protein